MSGKQANFEMHEDGLHLIFETEADAIAMMPKKRSIFKRQGRVIVMTRDRKLAQEIRDGWRTGE